VEKKILTLVWVVGLVVCIPCAYAQSGSGAGFVFSPSSGAYISGSLITVTASIDTKGNAINAADGTFSFPSDLLKVVSISKTNSIFKFWVQDPTFSNSNGTIKFSGGLPTPGFTGSSGTVFLITFQALGSGSAQLKVTDGSILANDGLGTNVLTFNQEPTYQISTAIQQPVVPSGSSNEKPAQVFGIPDSPSFFSRTHADEHAWYSSRSFEVSWNLPSDVDGVSYALVKNANYTLIPKSRGLIDHVSYDVTDLSDGVWYFYARLHNSSGWSSTASRAVRIDLLPPSVFAVTRVSGDNETNPSPALSFNTTDIASPINHYDIIIDDGSAINASTLKRGDVYVLPPQLPGSHLVVVRAYDSALNYTDELLQIAIKPLTLPVITSYSYRASPPQRPLVVSGFVPAHTASSGERVVLLLRGDGDSNAFEVPLNSDGTWSSIFSNRLSANEYSLSAYLMDSREARSKETEAKIVNIGGWLSDTLASIGEYSIAGAALVIGLGLIMGFAIYFYSRLLMMRKKFLADLKHFEQKLDADLQHVEKDLSEINKNGANSEIVHKKQKHLTKDIGIIKKNIKSEIEELKNLKEE
jgi:hypothetical protein